MPKGQTAIEFLSSYSFTFLIIAVVLFLLLLFAALPKATVPTQCTFYSGFNCADIEYYSTATGSQLVLVASNLEPGTVNVSNFSATINYLQSTSGYCTPTVSSAGQTVYCYANFTTSATLGNIYTVTFHMAANYCANAPSTNSTCKSSSAYSYAGQARTEGAGSNSNLPQSPVQDIFCVGASGGSRSVYYASASSTGIGSWKSTNSIPISISSAGCTTYNNNIYCVGSSTGNQNTEYYTTLSSNGVGNWMTSNTNYPIHFNNAGCSTYNGYIYCAGSSSTANVYYASVSSKGIGTWKSTTSYPVTPFADAGCSIYKGYIYCVGGSTDAAYYAPVSSAGVGTWKQTTSYTSGITFADAGCSIYDGYIYCVGSETSPETQVYYAPVSSGGIGNWIATTSYPIAITNAGCVVIGGHLDCIGSNVGPNTQVYSAQILNPGLGQWIAANSYQLSMQSAYCVVPGTSGGYLGGGGSST